MTRTYPPVLSLRFTAVLLNYWQKAGVIISSVIVFREMLGYIYGFRRAITQLWRKGLLSTFATRPTVSAGRARD